MYFIETILIGISLAMDAFAICLCQGLTTKENKEILALKLGITFGAFQAIMPWLGYSVGNIFSSKVSTYGNILAFIILLLIGINMIKEGKEEEKCEVLIGLKALLGLGIATSIDALAVGLSFAMNGQEKIYLSVGIIGIVTFIISVIGTNLGSKVGGLLGSKAHYFGGIVLILIGVKSLIG